MNSKRNNRVPLSLELELMLVQANAWSTSISEATDTIETHESEMLKILLNNLDITVLSGEKSN